MTTNASPGSPHLIKIFDHTGRACMAEELGYALFDRIEPLLSRGESVTLDFEGCRFFATPFFNRAIGRLYGRFAWADVERFVNYVNLSEFGRIARDDSIENAKRKFASPDSRAAVEEAVADDETATDSDT